MKLGTLMKQVKMMGHGACFDVTMLTNAAI